jgi:hypothetical protein
MTPQHRKRRTEVKRERRQVYIRPDQFEQVRREAFDRNDGYSDVIERALAAYFRDRPPGKARTHRRTVPA